MQTPKPTTRQLHVVSKTWISPHLVRVTLTGEDMADFPEGRESANCKLLFANDTDSPIVRTYTVRHYHGDTQEVAIDFFIHESPGCASSWAAHASVGDKIGFKGPSSPKLVNEEADFLFLAGDMSAMPALEANLERLSSTARGITVFEVVSDEDKRAVASPEGMDVRWVVNPHPDQPNTVLYDAVTAISLPSSRTAVWVAGESGCIRKLRRYFKDDVGIERSHFYGSGYWQIGLTEDAHQMAKRREGGDGLP